MPHSNRTFRAVLQLTTAAGLLWLAGCGEPAQPPATPAASATPNTATSADAKPADSTGPATAPVGGETPPPPPPPKVEQTVDADQMQTVRRWLDESNSNDAKKVQPALENLKKMGNLAALPLAEIVAQDGDNPARQVAAMDQLETLKFMTNPRVLEVVVAALGSNNEELKRRAIGVCGRQKLKSAMAPLKTIMEDPAQASLKVSAAQALIALGDPDALALAQTLLSSDSAVTRGHAVYMIRQQGESKNLLLLKPMVKDESRDVRMEVVQACGELGGVEAVELLGQLLDDDDHSVQRDSCRELKRITGVNIARDPEKWKEWLQNEFAKKGAAAFVKAGKKPGPQEGPVQPKVHRKVTGDGKTPTPDADGLMPEGDDNEQPQKPANQ